jgi:hypothetical protein
MKTMTVPAISRAQATIKPGHFSDFMRRGGPSSVASSSEGSGGGTAGSGRMSR